MFVDARRVPDRTKIDVDCCIIGGGVAGIAIAREFMGTKLKVALLESGGFRRERATQTLYDGENQSDIYEPEACGSFEGYLTSSRSRFLGGSSNCWGGWCRPFDDIDFLERPWIEGSGWPFTKPELMPFYARAHHLLRLGPPEYDPVFWRDAVNHRHFDVIPFDPGIVKTLVSQFSPPVRLGQEYRGELAVSGNVTTYLHANAVEIALAANGALASEIKVATLSGVRFTVTARTFVLAAGGIENARLLLASNQVALEGVGNGHDLVGRYFMEHASVPTAKLTFARPGIYRQCYDSVHFYNNQKFSAHNVCVAAHLGVTPAEQERHRILNSRTYIKSILRGDNSAGVGALRNLYRFARRTHKHRAPRWSDITDILAGIGDLAAVALGRLTGAEEHVSEYRLCHVVEPCPDRLSRVRLQSERDRLGVQKVVLDWRRGPLERATIAAVQTLIGEELAKRGLGRIEPWMPRDHWPADMQWVWHHMGTTRMNDDPRQGVVDRNSKVHGLANLYVAGSSVFPTGGADAPTLTIAALAIRLADYLKLALSEVPPATLTLHRTVEPPVAPIPASAAAFIGGGTVPG
ncbi:MAG TPA: GMC family oxidoreductase [Stellaceae bacterium]|nr:GMC family oxidoreductase [Stellaceae bacterium]